MCQRSHLALSNTTANPTCETEVPLAWFRLRQNWPIRMKSEVRQSSTSLRYSTRLIQFKLRLMAWIAAESFRMTVKLYCGMLECTKADYSPKA